jgi:hypothetical protein
MAAQENSRHFLLKLAPVLDMNHLLEWSPERAIYNASFKK